MPTAYHACAAEKPSCKGLKKGIKGYHECAIKKNCKKADIGKLNVNKAKKELLKDIKSVKLKKIPKKKKKEKRHPKNPILTKKERKELDDVTDSMETAILNKAVLKMMVPEVMKKYVKTYNDQIDKDTNPTACDVFYKMLVDNKRPSRKGMRKLKGIKDIPPGTEWSEMINTIASKIPNSDSIMIPKIRGQSLANFYNYNNSDINKMLKGTISKDLARKHVKKINKSI